MFHNAPDTPRTVSGIMVHVIICETPGGQVGPPLHLIERVADRLAQCRFRRGGCLDLVALEATGIM